MRQVRQGKVNANKCGSGNKTICLVLRTHATGYSPDLETSDRQACHTQPNRASNPSNLRSFIPVVYMLTSETSGKQINYDSLLLFASTYLSIPMYI